MKTSQYFLPLKTRPKIETQNKNHALMVRAGLLRESDQNQITWLPFGLSALRKIEALLQEEMNNLGAFEICLPNKNNLVELAARTIQPELVSFKNLPCLFFQSNVLKQDLFSFHIEPKDFEKTKGNIKKIYKSLFSKLNLSLKEILSEEGFHYIHNEQAIASISQIREILTTLSFHIFNEQGKGLPALMGHYQIQLDSLLMSLIEQNQDENGLIWPLEIAPFQVAIMPISFHKSYRVRKTGEDIYKRLQKASFAVLFEDRKERLGILFSKMNLIGIPIQIIINERHLEEDQVQCHLRKTGETTLIPTHSIVPHLEQMIRT